MNLALNMDIQNSQTIIELLSIWNITYSDIDKSEITISYGKVPSKNDNKTFVIPSGSSQFGEWSKDANLNITKDPGKPFSVYATPNLALTFWSKITYNYDESKIKKNSDLIVLNVDVIKEYEKIVNETLRAKSSIKYRLFTSLPVPYNLAPKELRAVIMKENNLPKDINICNFLSIDALRFILANALEKLSGKKLERRIWPNRKCSFSLTHDVETRTGLEKATRIKKLEEKYDVSSAWFIPTKHYSLDNTIVQTLSNDGEIASHDTKHDGKLFYLSGKKLIDRLLISKRNLETISKKTVSGFRAPLLQHSPIILRTLKECGYRYDSSIPTWEPKHPRTMKSHGIGTVFPISLEGFCEIPITITQDHQFLHVMDYDPQAAMAAWNSSIEVIKELCGSCVFLSHPEYALLKGNDLSLYEGLLNSLSSDHNLFVTLPEKIVDLWSSKKVGSM